MLSLKGKVALITGASRGIGKAIALSLASQGMKLALSGSSPDNLREVEKEAAVAGAEVFLCPSDLTDPKSPENMVKMTIEFFGALDVLINNAGIAVPSPAGTTSTELWDLHMAVNARAPFLLCREAIPYLLRSEAASIINIASVVGSKGYVNQAAYTASKHALMGFTKVLAQELHHDNIRVHVISPGGVATDMAAQMRPDLNMPELISPQEIADIVLFLLTHRGNAVIDEINVHRVSNSPWK